jgi:hypothetical protein
MKPEDYRLCWIKYYIGIHYDSSHLSEGLPESTKCVLTCLTNTMDDELLRIATVGSMNQVDVKVSIHEPLR